MAIALYQLFIIATLKLTQMVAPKKLAAACGIWTALTIINVFMPALAALQLLVIWVTYGILAKKDEPRSKPSPAVDAQPPSPPKTSSAAPVTDRAITPEDSTRAASSAEVVQPTQERFSAVIGSSKEARIRTTGALVATHTPASPPWPQSFKAALPSTIADGAAETASEDKSLKAIFDKLVGSANTDTVWAPPDARSGIRRRATDLAIPCLLHFTRVDNLASIFQHGLCSIAGAAERGISPCINDRLRLDGRLDAISLSIAFPNYRMFYRYRAENPTDKWAVLAIDPAILWLKNCAFANRNAADRRIRDLPLSQLQGIAAFERMFEELGDLGPRAEQRLLPYDPTDPQAEVLVFETIEPQYIREISFDNADALQTADLPSGFGNRNLCQPNKGLFGSRSINRKTNA